MRRANSLEALALDCGIANDARRPGYAGVAARRGDALEDAPELVEGPALRVREGGDTPDLVSFTEGQLLGLRVL